MKVLFGFFLVLLLLTSCSSMYDATATNRQNLLFVSLGMDRDNVSELMGHGYCAISRPHPLTITSYDPEIKDTYLTFRRGFSSIKNPHKSETIRIKNHYYTIDYYVTGCAQDGIEFTEEELTPLIFDNNKLIGWGWDFLSELRGDNNYYDSIVVKGV